VVVKVVADMVVDAVVIAVVIGAKVVVISGTLLLFDVIVRVAGDKVSRMGKNAVVLPPANWPVLLGLASASLVHEQTCSIPLRPSVLILLTHA
jgi:hypothetical protein